MLVLVVGHHADPNRLAIARTLNKAGAHTGDAARLYQDLEFRTLTEQHLDWRNPDPAPFDVDRYDELFVQREEDHEVWVLSDPRIVFYIDDFLSLAKSHRSKSRIVLSTLDVNQAAKRIADRHGLSIPEATRIARASQDAIDQWCEATRRRYVEINELTDDALDELGRYLDVEITSWR